MPRGRDAVSFTYSDAAFDDKNVGTNKKVTVSGFTLGGADAGNYLYTPLATITTATITPRALKLRATAADKAYDGSVTARASIRPLSLTVTANPDARLADGIPYRGGNGVAYAGFLEGETAADLEGQLRYGGTAQGAMKEGSYRITPGGVASLNYAARFIDGALTMRPLPPGAGIIAAYTEPAAPALPMQSGRDVRSGTGGLRITDCGMRMPENVMLGSCGSLTSQAASFPNVAPDYAPRR